MKRSREFQMQSLAGIIQKWRRRKLALACLVIALCFALGNDIYRAKAIVLKNKDLFPGQRRAINYLEAKKNQSIAALLRTDMKRRYLIDPRRSPQNQKTPLTMFVGGATCATGSATPITAIPFNDTGAGVTTVGKGDDYDLLPALPFDMPTGCPTCSGAEGTPAGNRGFIYTGTGTGPDAVYSITFAATGNMAVTLTPTDPAGATADDLDLIVYGSVCSNNPSDAIVVSSTKFEPGNPAGNTGVETVSIAGMPAGKYHIVVDGYSYTAPAGGGAGPYTLAVTNAAGQTTVQPRLSVSGKIFKNTGAPLRNALVTITGPGGTQSVLSDPQGFYEFTNVQIGLTYTISVLSKSYRFDPELNVVFTDSVINNHFVGTN